MLGAIFSIASSIGSAISGAVSGIGSALSSFSTGVGGVLGTLMESLKPLANTISKFANTFLQALGILKSNESVEELGERALQAADQGITLGKFDDFDEYMAKLRDFELDSEVSEKRSPTEKLVAGLGIGTVGVEDKFNTERGSLNGLWLLHLANPAYFTPERMQSLVETGRFSGDIFAYLEGRLSGGEARDFEKSLEADLPQAKLNELYENLDSAKEEWAKLADNPNAPAQ